MLFEDTVNAMTYCIRAAICTCREPDVLRWAVIAS